MHHTSINKQKTMSATLDISDDVLFAAKETTPHEHKTRGEVTSQLALQAIAQQLGAMNYGGDAGELLAVYGIEPLPKRGGVLSNQLIDRLRDDEGT